MPGPSVNTRRVVPSVPRSGGGAPPLRQDKRSPRCAPLAYAASRRACGSRVGRPWDRSLTASGRRGRFRWRGRALITCRHASQPSSRQASTPRRWTPTASGMRGHTRQHVPRLAAAPRLPSGPHGRRARRSPPQAYRRVPSPQPAANGRPAGAPHVPTSTPRFPRAVALALGPLPRSRALLGAARSRQGPPGVKPSPHPAQPRVVAVGVRPVCRRWARLRGRAPSAGASARRSAGRAPRTASGLVGARTGPSLGRLGAHGGARQPGRRSTRGPSGA
jgi:hypothetical protein